MLDWLVGFMLFHPTPGIDIEPGRFGIRAEQVRIETEDGVSLHGFWLPADGAERALLFLHGNAGNASHRLPNAELLRRLGLDVLVLDYRGYGMSEGSANLAGLALDARAGLAHLTGARGIPEERVILFGRSLGGAVAVELAAGRALGGIILESTFTSLADVARSHFGALGGWAAQGQLDSVARIGAVRAPLLFFHGDRDEIIPYDLGRRLYEAAPEPKSFETLAGAGHNDTVEVGGRAYVERIGRFVNGAGG